MTAKEAFLRWRLEGRGRRVESKGVILLIRFVNDGWFVYYRRSGKRRVIGGLYIVGVPDSDFKAQGLAKTAWTLATAGRVDAEPR